MIAIHHNIRQCSSILFLLTHCQLPRPKHTRAREKRCDAHLADRRCGAQRFVRINRSSRVRSDIERYSLSRRQVDTTKRHPPSFSIDRRQCHCHPIQAPSYNKYPAEQNAPLNCGAGIVLSFQTYLSLLKKACYLWFCSSFDKMFRRYLAGSAVVAVQVQLEILMPQRSIVTYAIIEGSLQR